MVERDIYNILHGGKGEEQGRIAAVNLRCAAPIRRKATETEGLVIVKESAFFLCMLGVHPNRSHFANFHFVNHHFVNVDEMRHNC